MVLQTSARWFSLDPFEPTSYPPSPSHEHSSNHITDAFHEFIQNDMPSRLIDTSNLTFVERNDIFDIFSPEIASITEEDIQRRMCAVTVDPHPEAGIYVIRGQYKAALREIIRDVVRYAIFSHRWTGSEPSHKKVSTLVSSGVLSSLEHHSRTTDGIAKLVQLCDTARSLGYKLVWSDTCCIDKTNAAELNEAVQAMFKWYANAHLCIVHLGASLSVEDFGQDQWFRRGWTLQELLAPRRIKFYDKTWRPLTALANDKDDEPLMTALSRITGIPWEVVVADNSEGVKGRGIWEIMSWASARKTTRTEDVAYCLIGLFDVSIHTVYGEGEKAFTRLLRAIVEKHPSWDVFGWAGQPSKSHSALPCSPSCYSKWNGEIMNAEVGMKNFSLTSHSLRLMSVPLIPMEFEEVKGENRSYVVTLRPRPHRTMGLGKYSNVYVNCGESRLAYIRTAKDLHVCILNYNPVIQNRGQLQVGKTYVCFLLHMKNGGRDEATWLKFATDNILHITCSGAPERTSVDGTFNGEERTFSLELKATHIRGPSRTQSTLRT